MRTFLGVPLMIRGEAWGNIYLTEKQGGAFDDDDLHAVDGARRLGGDRDRRTRACIATPSRARPSSSGPSRDWRRRRRSRARVGSETDLDRVLELIVKRGRALVRARTVVLLLREGERLVAAAGAGQLDDGTLGASLALDGSVAGEVLRRGRAGAHRRRLRAVRRARRAARGSSAPRPRCWCR